MEILLVVTDRILASAHEPICREAYSQTRIQYGWRGRTEPVSTVNDRGYEALYFMVCRRHDVILVLAQCQPVMRCDEGEISPWSRSVGCISTGVLWARLYH
jgi:hypothetical protein